MTAAAVAVAVLAFYAFFYGKVVRYWGPVVGRVIERLALGATRSIREIEAVGKLTAAGVAQALFAAGLLYALGTDLGEIARFNPGLIVLGALLGFGELALASFVGTVVVRFDALRRSDASPDWIAQGRGGWMGYFGATVAAAPPWFALAVVSLYVGGEELVFRGILVDAAAAAGGVTAVLLSLVLFVVVQSFNMPSVRAATFPIVGAVVVGSVHGVLFWQTYDVVPLIAAHLTFFAGALLLAASPRPSAAVP